MKGNREEFIKIKKDDRLQLRINKKHKEKLKELANKRGYKSLSDYMLYLALKDIQESEFINRQMIKEFE